MSNGIKVVKRSGDIEPLNLDKIHLMVECACKDLAGVSASQVEMNSGIQFYDGISTDKIQEILVRSASDLVSLDHPNYQFVAARLLLFGLYKQVFGDDWKSGFPDVRVHLIEGISKCIYDQDLINKYSNEEWDKIDIVSCGLSTASRTEAPDLRIPYSRRSMRVDIRSDCSDSNATLPLSCGSDVSSDFKITCSGLIWANDCG